MRQQDLHQAARHSRQPPTLPAGQEDTHNWTFYLGLALCVLALLLAWHCGQLCQKAKNDGISIGMSSAQVQADQRAYDRGYADAVWDIEHNSGKEA